MDNHSNHVSARQLELLLDFVEQHHSLAIGRVRGKEASALSKKLWSQCAKILNSEFGGAKKSEDKWKKYYNQYKSRAKAKLRGIKQDDIKTGGVPVDGSILSPFEKRLIGILESCSFPMRVGHNSIGSLNTLDLASDSDSNPGGDYGDDKPEMLDDNRQIYKSEFVPGLMAIGSPPITLGPKNITGEMWVYNMCTSAYPFGEYSKIKTELFIIPNENVEDVLDSAAPKCNSESDELYERKRPLREINAKPLKRHMRKCSSSPKVNQEFEVATQQLADLEKSRIEVDRELVQAIHRHASAMEDIAGAVNRFVNLYEVNLLQNDRSSKHKDKDKPQDQ